MRSIRSALPQLISGIAGLAWALILLPEWRTVTTTAGLVGRRPGDFESMLSSLYAAMRDPIDWSRPLFFDNIEAPVGTTLFLTDMVPAVALPMRLLHQLLGITLDPQITLTLLSVVFFSLGCASIARLAVTLGADSRAALISGLLPLLAMPWACYIPQGIIALSGWFVVVLIIDTLIRMERGGVRRKALISLFVLLTLSLWINPYYGLSGVILTGMVILRRLSRQDIRSGLVLAVAVIGSIAPLLLLGASGPSATMPSLLSGGGSGRWGLGAGLFRLDFLDPEWGLYSQYIRYWGLPFTLLGLVALPRVLRLGAVGVGAILLGLYATGSPAAGGFLPEVIYQVLPFNNWASIDRFFAPLMILAIAIGPMLWIEWLISTRSRVMRPLRALPAIVLAGLLVAEAASALTGTNGGLSVTREASPGPNDTRLTAIVRLVAQHRLVVISPEAGCYGEMIGIDQHDSPALAAVLATSRLTALVILAAADTGASVQTSLAGRRTYCTSEDFQVALPPGALVILFRSTLVDSLPSNPDLVARPLPATYTCAERSATPLFQSAYEAVDPIMLIDLRVCSERSAEIQALAKEIAARVTRGDDRWGTVPVLP